MPRLLKTILCLLLAYLLKILSQVKCLTFPIFVSKGAILLPMGFSQ
jgi:hypothetical protein